MICLALAQAGQMKKQGEFQDPRYSNYRSAGEWLRDNTPVGASSSALEAGIIGYYARRPMIDFAGLLQPETAAMLGAFSDYQDAARWAIELFRPDYLVLWAGAFPQLEQGYVSQYCHLAHRIQGVPDVSSKQPSQASELLIFTCNRG
jgi:hypothetical protein